MEPIQLISKARSAARCGVSSKLCNAVDGLNWPTEGPVFGLAGRCCAPLPVNQTAAQSAPSRQTRKGVKWPRIIQKGSRFPKSSKGRFQ